MVALGAEWLKKLLKLSPKNLLSDLFKLFYIVSTTVFSVLWYFVSVTISLEFRRLLNITYVISYKKIIKSKLF